MSGRNTKKYPQEWKSRRQVPNLQIKSVADQYEEARRLLREASKMRLLDGVLLPLMNLAAIAIELYLKCLAAETVHVPTGDKAETYWIYAESQDRHNLVQIFGNIEDDVRCQLERDFAEQNRPHLRDRLVEIGDVFKTTRYLYEPDMNFDGTIFPSLMSISKFLRDFVADLEPKETVRWADGTPTVIRRSRL
jgi:hypothetical protein